MKFNVYSFGYEPIGFDTKAEAVAHIRAGVKEAAKRCRAKFGIATVKRDGDFWSITAGVNVWATFSLAQLKA